MLFNSIDFALFLPIVFLLYWGLAKNRRSLQNSIILISSYVFYGWWDWRFLSLILFSTIVDYLVALAIKKQTQKRSKKILLLVSIFTNIGLLGFFKYYNFFIDNFIKAFTLLGKDLEVVPLSIILPVGISFYTFQTLSYTIDVYRGKLEPTTSFVQFATFVCFFPQLVAGPIERAKHLLPQFERVRKLDKEQAVLGINQILWGLFKKVVIADNCAQYVNDIFSYHETYTSGTLMLGAIYFAFQIYCDFSGYSDIAIGTARLFGVDLMANFKYPYFSRDVAEFWRRWHISLSTWFRDYVYIPLGGNEGGFLRKTRNVMVVFIVSGFWHGANWTFIAWGGLNGLLFLPLFIFNRNRKYLDIAAENKKYPSAKELWAIFSTFCLITFGWIFFRANSISIAFSYLEGISHFDFAIERLHINRIAIELIPLVFLFVLYEWRHRKKEFPLYSTSILWVKAPIVILLILLFGSFSEITEFIYFQF
ncbi:MAG: membrane-bound O-acyltransferase family protein [Flavobacteriaceae bacterium]|nr:membrane-bound O-acyltransferase family protein [Flavobacteriaceae bacterium]|tara:strand:- start:115144 stop:116577 length:1434 start_codon:yes stop_codon:yes gene_type:complete